MFPLYVSQYLKESYNGSVQSFCGAIHCHEIGPSFDLYFWKISDFEKCQRKHTIDCATRNIGHFSFFGLEELYPGTYDHFDLPGIPTINVS